jgi:hypothetical protein
MLLDMPSVRQQEKELRFTRSGQAVLFWILAAMCGMAGLTLLVTSAYRGENEALPHAAWALIPILAACGLVGWAVRLTKHAYLILTPLGVDIFPLFRASTLMRTVWWEEIHSFDVEGHWATLHHNAERTAGVRFSLRPVAPSRRPLLIRAMESRVNDVKTG